ncbi:MAG TPA: hypothetical protein EYP35_05630 [Desulfobacterales bacterium]|nr:hypothetical protein [Desulfobacterales bacterium]HIP40051.1 hypothetical protein [Desulfocapsa sulfexigens]
MKGCHSGHLPIQRRYYYGKIIRYNFEALLHIQRVAAKTQEAYLQAVADISAFHNRPAKELSNGEI